MTLPSIALANMRQRALSTALTTLLVAIGVGLVSLILTLKEEVDRGFQAVAGKFDLIVGPRGSQLQLVLNTVFHMDKPVGNMPWRDYEDIKRKKGVRLAIPIVTGDSYKGFYLVGTTEEFFTRLEIAEGRKMFDFEAGGVFGDPRAPDEHEHEHGPDDHHDFEAVLGSEVARSTKLKVGDRFLATHGVAEGGEGRDDHNYRVVGVLRPTGTPHDRAVFCHLNAFFDIHEDSPEAKAKMLSGVLVLTIHPNWTGPIAKSINTDYPNLMAIYPTFAMRDLMGIVGNVNQVLVAIAFLVLFAAGVSILVAIYNSMNERRREIAIIRALGAPPTTVFGIIVIEAALICAAGGAAGLLLSRLAVGLGGGRLREVTGLLIGMPPPSSTDLWLFLGAIAIGVLSSLLPAVAAYRTDVATNIRPVN
jgi:putative ABC transport system permease protein